MPPKTGLPAGLTERELEIMELVAIGDWRTEIAQKLHFTEAVIGNDLRSIRHKLQSRTTTEAAVKLTRAGLIGRSKNDADPASTGPTHSRSTDEPIG